MTPAISGEIACSDLLRRVTCRRNFPYGPDCQPFCLQTSNERKL